MYNKQEDTVKIGIAQYINMRYPTVPFFTSWDHLRLPVGVAAKLKKMRWANPDFAWPDLFIAYPNGGYAGLWGEIKKNKDEIYLKNGEISNSHQIQKELLSLQLLQNMGYKTSWLYALDQAIEIIDYYLI